MRKLLKKLLEKLPFLKRKAFDLADLPSSFFVGQPYVNDLERIDCVIEVNFVFPAKIDPSEFFWKKSKITLNQSGAILSVSIQRKISKLLWNNIQKFHEGEGFILPYIFRVLPEVNKKLLDYRYLKGHLLGRTYSVMDAHSIFLIHANKRARLIWPVSISGFPPSESLAEELDQIYIRDYIDAMHSYFKNDFDDCIRRVITSVENLFKARKLKGVGGKKSFRSILQHNFDLSFFSNQVIVGNLLFVYKLRNKIVHDKFRIKSSNGWICRKAIGALNYFLQRMSSTDKEAYYVSSLAGQFLHLHNFLGGMMNLDDMEEYAKHRDDPIDPANIINTPEDMDRSMFTSLQITENEKSIVFKK